MVPSKNIRAPMGIEDLVYFGFEYFPAGLASMLNLPDIGLQFI